MSVPHPFGRETLRESLRVTTLNWLLEENQPSITYLTLLQLLEKTENDPEVQSAKQMIPKVGWGEVLANQHPKDGGFTVKVCIGPNTCQRIECSSFFQI